MSASSDRSDFVRGLALFWRLTGWIAGPVIAAALLGKWLDGKFGTDPWLFLACVGAAFLVSLFGIVRDSLAEIRKIESEARRKDPKA